MMQSQIHFMQIIKRNLLTNETIDRKKRQSPNTVFMGLRCSKIAKITRGRREQDDYKEKKAKMAL